MDFRSLLREIKEQVKLITTEDDAEKVTRAITALRDFSESHRRGIVQLRTNKEAIQRQKDFTDKYETDLDKSILLGIIEDEDINES
jgi:hypothetical protein